MPSIAVFDINETTLDLGPARGVIDDLMGQDAFDLFFGRLLQTSMATTATDNYQDFSVLAAAAVDSTAQTLGVALPSDAMPRFGAAMAGLPVYPEVAEALDRLRAGGWRCIALTNSAQASVDAQLAGAGVADAFEMILSVDSVRAFKPVAAPYKMALERAGATPDDAVMVACHDWDLAGAKAVGMHTAFVARPRMAFGSAYPAADFRCADFTDLADQLLAQTADG